MHIRIAVVGVIAALTLGLGYGPVLAQTGAGWLLSIHMFDVLTGWAVETEGGSGVVARGAVESVVRTTDGGIHWKDVTPHAPPGQKIALGRGSAFLVDWLNSSVAWVEAELDTPTHGTLLFRTVDGGQTWKSVTPPASGSFDFINARDGWMLVGNDIYRSTDAGGTWTKIASANFPGQYPTITFVDTTTGWINPWRTYTAEWVLYVTHDGGYTWLNQKLPPPPQVAPESPTMRLLMLFTARDYVLPVSTSDSRFVLYLTQDGGTTWTYTTPVSVTQWGPSSFADVNHGWVADGAVLYMTSDGGRQWRTVRPGPPFSRVAVGELYFVSPQVGWASGWPLFPPVLLKTLDGGHTWTPVDYTIVRQ